MVKNLLQKVIITKLITNQSFINKNQHRKVYKKYLKHKTKYVNLKNNYPHDKKLQIDSYSDDESINSTKHEDNKTSKLFVDNESIYEIDNKSV